ncbi:MAG: AAA family ATPase [Planctomycetota bacterium]
MIHRIRVQNFKSIVDVTVELSPVTVLVGRSGTGKSNFVEAIRLLRDVLPSQKAAQGLQKQWAQCRPATNPKGPLRFEVQFSISGIDDRFKYDLALADQGPTRPPVEERLNIGKRCIFHQAIKDGRNPHKSQWIVKPEVLPAPEPGPIALTRIPSITEVVIAFTALTSGIGCYLFSDNVLCRGEQSQGSTGLDDGATNHLGALKEIVTDLHDLNVRKSIVAALQRINPSVSSVELNDIQQPSHVVVGHKFNGKTLPLELPRESAGFRRFYAHLLALYQRPSKQTLLFEHPEDAIHPGALSLLAEEFNAAPGDKRGQILLTTHSPKFLDHFGAAQIRVVELDGFQTRIGFISDEQREAIHEKLLDAGELLTVDPARIQLEATEA